MAYPTSLVTGSGGIYNSPPDSWGTPEQVTIASGVATITNSYVDVLGEGATDDTLTTLTLAGAAVGDIVRLIHSAGDTITVDDANIDLGAATRAFTTGGQITLRYDGTSWVEMSYLDDADNA